MSRSVLLLQASDSPAKLGPVLAAQHWQLLRATHPQQLTAALLDPDCHVGVAVFDAALQCTPGELARIAEDSGMEWVAIVPSHQTLDPDMARALSGSFFDYHTLPLDEARLLYSVGHAYGKALLRRTTPPIATGTDGRYGMIGESTRMLTLYAQLEKVMRANAPLLLTGESGVGKELAARAVHLGSSRAAGPFVPVNCGAMPATLVESLLFGHERGAFTGAHERQIGSIEAADSGGIFLDEIGDLPLSAQASLLRFLQESTIMRVGSTRELRIDTRIIAATHVDLHAAARAGRFRDDLYYRLNVLTVDIPPLRERGDDSLLLAQHFFAHGGGGRAPGLRGFSAGALAAIRQHSWPGNVRELLNRIQHAMVMSDGPLITVADLQLNTSSAPLASRSLAHARAGTDRGLIEAALKRSGHNITAAARELGVSRVTLYRMLRRLHIRPRSNASLHEP